MRGLRGAVLGLRLGEHVRLVPVFSRTPSLRITAGSVSPCSSSVATVTKKARKTSVSRCGTVSGMTNAAASVTTPRIPDHEITAGTCQGGDGSCLADPAEEHPGQVGRREHPDRAGQHRRRRDHHAVDAAASRMSPAARDHRRELQPDQGEHDRLQDRVARPPHTPGPAAGWRSRSPASGSRGRARRRPPRARPEACTLSASRYDAERARPAPARSRPCGSSSRAPDAVHHPADGQPDGGAPDGREHEHAGRPEHRHPGARRDRDEHPEQRQRRRVVDQALAAEDRHRPGAAGPAGGRRPARTRRPAARPPRPAPGRAASVRPGTTHQATTPTTTAVNADQAHGEQPDRPQVGPDPEVGRLRARPSTAAGSARAAARRCGSNVTSMTPGISDAARPATTSTRADETPEAAADRGHGE